MIYSLLRSAAAVALRWYYSDVTIVGVERVPASGPLLVAVNHPNALVDVLVAGKAVPRRLLFTAKATLFANPITAGFFRWIGVVPLRRASDEGAQGTIDPARNAQVFDAIAAALAKSSAILIFPEGKSHDEPAMAPARTGAARMALHARDTMGVRGIGILPIGLVFEAKARPRSRILAIVGEPLDVDSFLANAANPVADLTAAIDSRVRRLTLNYATMADAERFSRLARIVSALLRFEAPSVSDSGDLTTRVEIERVLPHLRETLLGADVVDRDQAVALEAGITDLDRALRSHRISFNDLTISREAGPGALFVVRESLVLLFAGPFAVWGWLNHVVPFQAALAAGRRVRESAADPAMRTIIAGAAFVLMMYMVQGALVTLFAGPWWGLAYVVSLPITADINLRLRDRIARAARRARTYLYFRARPALHDRLVEQARALRLELVALAGANRLTDAG